MKAPVSKLVWVVLGMLSVLRTAPVVGQAPAEKADADEVLAGVGAAVGADAAADVREEAVLSGEGGGIWGRESTRRRLIPGLWGVHFFNRSPLRPFWTRGAGIQASGWFGGAFMNSYDELSLIGGLEREWLARRWSSLGVGVGVGYRVGVITGYDRQLFALADKTPILPFVGLDMFLQAGPVGVDVFYVYRALSVEASIEY
jgi:hypothetical protein